MAEKFITSHSARVKKAKEHIANSALDVSYFDREAFVEYYLLEDILRKYEYLLKQEEKSVAPDETKLGMIAHKKMMKKFESIIQIFKTAIDVASRALRDENYKAVWKAIHEGALMRASRSTKNIHELRMLSCDMLQTLMQDTDYLASEATALDEYAEAVEAHDANVARISGMPSAAEIEEIIRFAEEAIPDPKPRRRARID